ncbi:MAG: cupredoxin family copper-binding protein [Actinomycetota bacterium]|nr:cupredoxin family copper-binding protein [Actinomycetota bacterium]
MADEAEARLDTPKLRRRPGRPAMGRGGGQPPFVAAAIPQTSASAGPTCPERSEAEPARVDIVGFAFCPAVLTVPIGSEVRWVNADLSPHTATDDGPDGTIDSGPLAQGQSWSRRFTRPGTYSFYCRLHPGMSGTVIVAG